MTDILQHSEAVCTTADTEPVDVATVALSLEQACDVFDAANSGERPSLRERIRTLRTQLNDLFPDDDPKYDALFKRATKNITLRKQPKVRSFSRTSYGSGIGDDSRPINPAYRK